MTIRWTPDTCFPNDPAYLNKACVFEGGDGTWTRVRACVGHARAAAAITANVGKVDGITILPDNLSQ